MATAPKPSKTESQGSEARRSSRLRIAIPITISGKDVNGEAFRERVLTLLVNAHGAKIVTCHQLAVGLEVLIDNPALVRSVKANVVWVGEKLGPSGLLEVGVQLFQAQNIWGIEFPPDDWQAEEPAVTKPEAASDSATAPARPGEPLSSATPRLTPPGSRPPGGLR